MMNPSFDHQAWDALIDRAFDLDDDHPMISQSIEEDDVRILGGPGSGNFDHAGRPGEVGGSAPGKTWTADEVMKKENLDPDAVAKVKERILNEATTENERKYADELAVAESVIMRDSADGDTQSRYTNPDGSYKTWRLAEHDRIIHQYFKDYKDKHGALPPSGLEKPVVTFMAGMPGAGKSTSAKDLQKSGVAITIDPDSVKPYMKEYKNGLGSAEVARESGDIADKIMLIAAKSRMNVVIDGTMKTSGALPATYSDGALGKMAAFKEAGYRVEVRFVDVGVNQSITNTVQRFHEQFQADGRGRYVPTSFSRLLADSVHGTKPRASFELAKNLGYKGQPLVDAWTHHKGWTGDPATSHKLLGSFGTLTQGGGEAKRAS